MSLQRYACSLIVFSAAAMHCLQAQAEVNDRTASPVNRIVDVSDDNWQPAGFVNGVAVPAIYVSEPGITMDGQDDEAAWQKAFEVTVPLQYGHISEVRLKALYSDGDVYIRVQWPDATQDREHHPWTWDAGQGEYVEGPQIEDSVLLSFEAGCEWTPSLLGGYIYDFDAWQWLAARSDPLGQALDLYGNVQDRDLTELGFTPYRSRVLEDDWILKFTENHDVDLTAKWNELDRVYMLLPVTENLYIKMVPDGGKQSPPFVEQLPAPASVPVDEERTFAQFNPIPLTGSAGEVAAKGEWKDGYWTVEFRRARETPVSHIYDTVFNRLVQFSVHIFDQTERIDEVAESPRLFLQFLPKETPLAARD